MRLIKAIVIVTIATGTAAALGGCAPSVSGGAYDRYQTRQAQDVRLGYVESVRQVLIEGTQSGVGAVTGAALGGLAGSTIGGGRGQVAGAIGGAAEVADVDEFELATRREGINQTCHCGILPCCSTNTARVGWPVSAAIETV